jgi:hypothetical protein
MSFGELSNRLATDYQKNTVSDRIGVLSAIVSFECGTFTEEIIKLTSI